MRGTDDTFQRVLQASQLVARRETAQSVLA